MGEFRLLALCRLRAASEFDSVFCPKGKNLISCSYKIRKKRSCRVVNWPRCPEFSWFCHVFHVGVSNFPEFVTCSLLIPHNLLNWSQLDTKVAKLGEPCLGVCVGGSVCAWSNKSELQIPAGDREGGAVPGLEPGRGSSAWLETGNRAASPGLKPGKRASNPGLKPRKPRKTQSKTKKTAQSPTRTVLQYLACREYQKSGIKTVVSSTGFDSETAKPMPVKLFVT